MIPSGGTVLYDRWIWLASGLLVFVFFGFGRDALNTYRSGLLAIGLGKVIPSLKTEYRGSITGTVSSFGSKAKMLFKRKSSASTSTWTSHSSVSHKSSFTEPISPEKPTFLDTINESSSTNAKQSDYQDQQQASRDHEKTEPLLSKKLSRCRPKPLPVFVDHDSSSIRDLTGRHATVQSAIVAGPRSPSLIRDIVNISTDGMVVRTEVRQGSVHEGLQRQ